jgi:hypothetical protein
LRPALPRLALISGPLEAIVRGCARRPRTVAFVLYLAVGLLFFGVPVLHDPGHECICVGKSHDLGALATRHDPGTYMWALVWWPHALVHGLNPFYTHLLFAPAGVNLAHGALIPGPALVLAPVTAVLGPLASFNLLMLLAPVLAAFFAFLLCLHLTGRVWPSLVGGYLFGFSTYMLGHMVGHPNLALVFLVPAIVHLTLLALDGGIGTRRYLVLLALALIGQFLISAEVFVTLTLFGAITIAVGYLIAAPEVRRQIIRVVPSLVGAYIVAAIVISPYLFYALKPGGVPVQPSQSQIFSNDLLSFVFPTEITQWGRHYFLTLGRTYTARDVEAGAYLGLPLVVILSAFVFSTWRQARTRVLATAFVVSAIASLGPHLLVAGIPTIPLPWGTFDRAAVLGLALPARFVLYATLAAAVMAALWLAMPSRRPVWRWLLAGLAVLALEPNFGGGYWHGRPSVPGFFNTAAHKKYLDAKDIVLIPPIGAGGDGMLWHAKAGLDFRLAGGYVVPPRAPDPYKREPLYLTLTQSIAVPHAAAATRDFLTRHSVTKVVINPKAPGPWPTILRQLGFTADRVDGVLLYRVAH